VSWWWWRRPRGVRVVTPDGGQIPLSVERGPRRGGQRVWFAYGPPGALVPAGATLSVDSLPGHSTVRLALVLDAAGAARFAASMPAGV
jgi:hypothetical protein